MLPIRTLDGQAPEASDVFPTSENDQNYDQAVHQDIAEVNEEQYDVEQQLPTIDYRQPSEDELEQSYGSSGGEDSRTPLVDALYPMRAGKQEMAGVLVTGHHTDHQQRQQNAESSREPMAVSVASAFSESCPSLGSAFLDAESEESTSSSHFQTRATSLDRTSRSRSETSLSGFDMVDSSCIEDTTHVIKNPRGRAFTRTRSKSARFAMQAAADLQQADWLANLKESKAVVSRLVETQEDGFAAFEFNEDETDFAPQIMDPAEAMIEYGITGEVRSAQPDMATPPPVPQMQERHFFRSSKSSAGLLAHVQESRKGTASGRRSSIPALSTLRTPVVHENTISLGSSPGDVGGPFGRSASLVDGEGFSPVTANAAPSKIVANKPASSGIRSMFQSQASLMDYLTAKEARTELDQVNAHFAVAEVLICAFEQMSSKQQLERLFADDEEPTTPLVNSMHNGLIAETPEHVSVTPPSSAPQAMRQSRIRQDSSTRSSFASTGSSRADSEIDLSDSDSIMTDDASEAAGDAVIPIPTTAYAARPTEDQLTTIETRNVAYEGDEMSTSPGSIARSLLSRYSSITLHTASELQSVMQEDDISRALLGLGPVRPASVAKSSPTSTRANASGSLTRSAGASIATTVAAGAGAGLLQTEVEVKRAEAVLSAISATQPRIRGDEDWAPPRAQIIFLLHPPQKKKQAGVKQKCRCAGCGMQVEPHLMKKFRYCEYLGKYFCHSCHGNQTALIPARILQKWDFRKYSVSNFAQDLLSHMYKEPLFSVAAINPVLYRRIKALATCQSIRAQLFYLKDFIRSCRLAQSLREQFEDQGHWVSEPHVYSIEDFTMVRQGKLYVILSSLVEAGVRHVESCPLCQARGFVCELCNKGSVIFPFQLDKCNQCSACRACYHKQCFQPQKTQCPKCRRLQRRRESRRASHPISP